MRRPRALDIKLLVLVIGILSVGMGVLTYVNIRRHEQDLIAGVRTKTGTVADSLCAGINSIMRTGDVCRTRDYVRDMRSVEGIANLKLYNAGGGEAFLYPDSVSAMAAADENITSVIESGRPKIINMIDGRAVAVTAPLLNEEACHSCHGSDHKVRGAFSVVFRIRQQEEAQLSQPEVMLRAIDLLNDTIVSFYEGLMLSGHGALAKNYVASLVLVPEIKRVTVYDAKGQPKFSTFSEGVVPTLTEKECQELLREGREITPRWGRGAKADDTHEVTHLRPLANRESCQGCHGEKRKVLGVMALTGSPVATGHGAGAFERALADTMVSLVTRCFQEVMKIGGVAPVRMFAQQFRSLPEITTVQVFDPTGREVYPEKVVVEDRVQKVFASGRPSEVIEEQDGQPYLTLLKPIFNGEECRRCHGQSDRVRAVIVVSISLQRIRERITRAKAFSVGAASATVFLVCILIVGFIEMVIVRPIRKIGEVADRVGAGNLSLRADDSKPDEFGRLAHRVNSMIEGLTDKQRIEQSLRIARDIQRSHLPKRNPEIPGFDIAGWSLPAEETGGDYYDFIVEEDGKLLVVLADVTSHGIGPALIMSQTRALVRAALLTEKDIPKAVGIVNSLLCADLIQGRFVTLFIGEIDPSAMALRYVSAGHSPPFLFRRGARRTEDLNTTGLPLGINPEARFEAGPPVTLHEGDLLLLATDGVSEACNGKKEHFGRDRLRQELLANAERPAAHIIEAISTAVRNHRAGAQQRDDVTMVVVRVSTDSLARAPRREGIIRSSSP